MRKFSQPPTTIALLQHEYCMDRKHWKHVDALTKTHAGNPAWENPSSYIQYVSRRVGLPL